MMLALATCTEPRGRNAPPTTSVPTPPSHLTPPPHPDNLPGNTTRCPHLMMASTAPAPPTAAAPGAAAASGSVMVMQRPALSCAWLE